MKKIYMCATQRHLLDALVDVVSEERVQHTIFFLTDHQTLRAAMISEVAGISNCELIPIQEKDIISEFAFRPFSFNKKIQRNVSFKNLKLITPVNWTPSYCAMRDFDIGVIYHPNLVASKSLRKLAQRIVLREDGYANYASVRKGLKRFLYSGCYFYGVESWIDQLEMSRLPCDSVAQKFQVRRLIDELKLLNDSQIDLLRKIYLGDLTNKKINGKTALIAGLDLSRTGKFSTQEYISIVKKLIAALKSYGFNVVFKSHPADKIELDVEAYVLSKDIPLEVVPFFFETKFDLSFTFGSSAFISAESFYSKRQIELIETSDLLISRNNPAYWDVIKSKLERRLLHIDGLIS